MNLSNPRSSAHSSPRTRPRSSRRSFLSSGASLVGSTLLAGAWKRTAASAGGGKASARDLDFASALEAARAIRAKEVSALELTERQLARIERYNPRLNAVVTLTREEALARARAADEALSRGEWWGPFHGVPCTNKDTFERAGVRTTAGSKDFANHVPAKDSVVVARLRAAGAVLLGQTNVPPMAADWQSDNEV